MKTIEEIRTYLEQYNGRTLRLMEICGSHTAAIARSGIRGLLSEKIQMVSGPGCPVCVTPSAYIDRLIGLSKEKDTCVVTFGDLLRVPGSRSTLNAAKGEGGNVRMVYSPLDTIKLAKENPKQTYVFAAVGFETTAPVYTLLLEQLKAQGIGNVRLLTAIKTMPPVVDWLLSNDAGLDGFLAPGHVCAVMGSNIFLPAAEKYRIPFVVGGFTDKELLLAIYDLVRLAEQREACVKNDYPSVVTDKGNGTAQEKLKQYFKPYPAVWRGMGEVYDSGLLLKQEYEIYDAGSEALVQDQKKNPHCCCDQVLMGKMKPQECPLFQKVCTPQNPQGACMVSYEGSCHQQYVNAAE